jgi:hypothetical protein
MISPILILGGIGAAMLLSSRRKTIGAGSLGGYAIGEGPFDNFPSGTDDVVTSINSVKSSAGNSYTVHEFKRDGGQRYYVAVRSDASKDWVGYLFDPIAKTRLLYRANAEDTTGIDALKKDFAL